MAKVQKGKKYPMTFAIDDEIFNVHFVFYGREVIDVKGLGKVNAIKFSARLIAGEIFNGDTDVMISGNGYFVVQDGDGKQYYTRDGVFTTDSDGNLVTQSGMKVVGATAPYSGTASNVTVRIPTNLKASITDSSTDDVNAKIISELNVVNISSGDFYINLKDAAGDPQKILFTVDANDTVENNIKENVYIYLNHLAIQ